MVSDQGFIIFGCIERGIGVGRYLTGGGGNFYQNSAGRGHKKEDTRISYSSCYNYDYNYDYYIGKWIKIRPAGTDDGCWIVGR